MFKKSVTALFFLPTHHTYSRIYFVLNYPYIVSRVSVTKDGVLIGN
jgi:hypothetical protein